MPFRFILAAVSAIALTTSPALALDWLHTQVKVGTKTCMATHYHHIDSGAFAARALAEATAARRWERFTQNEYGPRWARLALAEGKVMDCTEGKNTRGAVWSCKLKAKPCRA